MTTHEILRDRMTGGDEERHVKEVIRWMIRDTFGSIFLTSPMYEYYLLGHLDSYRMLDSIVTRRETIMDIYSQMSEHFFKLTGTSMMNLVV